MSTTIGLMFDGDILRWNGSLPYLKHFVDEALSLKGRQSSPGGVANSLVYFQLGIRYQMVWPKIKITDDPS